MRAGAPQGSTVFWALSQNSGVVRKAAASLSAISAVTEVAVHDSIDHLDVAADVTGNLLPRHSKRQPELLPQDLARPRGWSSPSHRARPIMVVPWPFRMSTSAGPDSVQRKMIRHGPLGRMP